MEINPPEQPDEESIANRSLNDPLKTKRIGLSTRPKDDKHFHLLNLRYVSDPRNYSNIELKIRGIESLVSESVKSCKLEQADVFPILKYNKKI